MTLYEWVTVGVNAVAVVMLVRVYFLMGRVRREMERYKHYTDSVLRTRVQGTISSKWPFA